MQIIIEQEETDEFTAPKYPIIYVPAGEQVKIIDDGVECKVRAIPTAEDDNINYCGICAFSRTLCVMFTCNNEERLDKTDVYFVKTGEKI